MHNELSTAVESARNFSCYLADDTETLKFGEKLSAYLKSGIAIHLTGNLGSGKTTLTRGMLRGLGYSHAVKSPTYNLVEIYEISGLYFYHFDFYRFNDYLEWEEAGFREYFNADSICVVEWPEKAGDLLPPPDLRCIISVLDAGRQIEIQACTETGKQCLTHWKAISR
ncbi:MAG: tRNA (adenosine(37)-N6)-threonylcarbamoyltransferase complex ATPase subunit type 1 TsaE [Nitrosomonas sp.]|uniref:tRNA (adenosine(37)-N6)-threonylcarbamoyltransferase complex ATPase subunit type 1 TsaE n=1 Tax=Nitrosomonas sp. TaxID=42353 RepID=UPI001D483633|nr:tRNA (adenosine(37)-N6)-threonylcarbamoyltransferase complex ATPase subunit type 1 TsaE [Nitrosomonas sp.]MBX9895714.1 tRNA (adenosine(37)-N6)-threonylcarbamoyltransferase complex ATPase subunit type 1 TsaE [Nitrosomonas sp.]